MPLSQVLKVVCQTEVGSASAMSAAFDSAAGGTPYQASQAIAFVIKNMLGPHL